MRCKKTKYFFCIGIVLPVLLMLTKIPSLPAPTAEDATAVLSHCFPYAQQMPIQNALVQAADTLFGFLPGNPESMLKSQIALCSVTPQVAQTPQPQPAPATQDTASQNSYPIVETKQTVAGLGNTHGENKQIYIDNDTDFDIDINALLNEPVASVADKSAPTVLIVHTHTTESYTPDSQTQYTDADSTRSLDKTQNVVRVGEEIARVLTEAGIGVLHDQTINDHPSYNGAYTRTLSSIENYLSRYPTIQIVLDVHRDAMTKSDGTKLKLTADISGTKAAQVMLVVGTNAGGLPHENWRENLKFALHLQNKITAKYPGLARPINLRTERFNQHATAGSLIVEVGTDGNTLAESIAGARYFADALAKLF